MSGRRKSSLENLPLTLHSPRRSYGSLSLYHFVASYPTNTKTLHRSDSMVSLSYRTIVNFIDDDNIRSLQEFLENKRVLVDDRDEIGGTSLMVASARGKIGFVRELINHGADVNIEDADNWTALLCAAKEGHTAVCAELIEHGANIEQRDMGGWTALMWCSYKGHLNVVKLFLEHKVDVNAHGNYHISSLSWAAGRGHVDIVKELLKSGAKVNVGDKYGTTPLIWACRRGNTEIVDCLLNAGANVDSTGMYSWTPLLVATFGNHIDVVHLLLERRPNVNALDKDGCAALTIACKEGYRDIAMALLNAGAYINIQDRGGDTNLIHAVKGSHRGVVEALIKKYADVNITGKDRKTAIYWGVEKGNVAIVKMLLTANPDLETATKDGDTPLLRAVRSRNVEITQLLLEKKAKVSAADKKGDTGLHIAMRARSKAIVEVLLRNPKHSQLLYRPNRAGETPYNIDVSHQKTILGQIFGARRLNTNEDNENMLGYDLYSSALADILSEPSLSMPITVGLYAKWGSGKSFLLNKLRSEMQNFAREWVNPTFHFSSFIFLVVVQVAVITGVVVSLAVHSWVLGVSIGAGIMCITYTFLLLMWFSGRRSDWYWSHDISVYVTKKLNSLKLMLQVMFCHPPGLDWKEGIEAQPIRYYFTDQTKVSTTSVGENSVVQMIGSLYESIENDHGAFPTRLFRAFRPKPVKSTSAWRWRRLCCLPTVLLFSFCLLCLLIGVIVLTVCLLDKDSYRGYYNSDEETGETCNTITVQGILITVGLILGVGLVANLYTWGQMLQSIVFSQRKHLQRQISRLDTLKSEGVLQSLRSEVTLMTEMVRCLDGFTQQQTRLVAIVDGLDSCEQDKVLLVLDAVHMLFSNTEAPFIIILAIDPHVISKAIEMNIHKVFSESHISGYDYLRNMVHLPFYLQNSGLRKVKIAQHAAQNQKKAGLTLSEAEDTVSMAATSALGLASPRRLSTESGLGSSDKMKNVRRGSRKLRPSDSIASSLGSNLNRIGGAQDLTKMLLTDDYFSDVNPRSMRRLMNVVYITGRLLKSFQIDFNWYHLALWINITEQWPFRTSWIILYHETYEDNIDDNTPLKTLYDIVHPQIPLSKENEPLLELDRDERKFDVFLSCHKGSLLVNDLKVFLPFTINLDPYIKKVIKEEIQNQDDMGLAMGRAAPSPVALNIHKMSQSKWKTPVPSSVPMWYPDAVKAVVPLPASSFPPAVLEKKLSTMAVKDVCDLLRKVEDIAPHAQKYEQTIKESNINGRVLLHCDLDDLKKVLKMSFGDWEIFKMVIISLRSGEYTEVSHIEEHSANPKVRFAVPEQQQQAGTSRMDKGDMVSASGNNIAVASSKQTVLEKQVTLEDQMICGALQTLNEAACEDVLEGAEDSRDEGFLGVSTSEAAPGRGRYRTVSQSSNSNQDTEVVFLQSVPLPYQHIHACSQEESVSAASSVCGTPVRQRRELASSDPHSSKPPLPPHTSASIRGSLHNLNRADSIRSITSNISGTNSSHFKDKICLREDKGKGASGNNILKIPRRPSSLLVDESKVKLDWMSNTPPPSPRNQNNSQPVNEPKLLSFGSIKKKSALSLTDVGSGITPTSSLEKLNKLKDKLLRTVTLGAVPGNHPSSYGAHCDLKLGDNDSDESTPLVSELASPSIAKVNRGFLTTSTHSGGSETESGSMSYVSVKSTPVSPETTSPAISPPDSIPIDIPSECILDPLSSRASSISLTQALEPMSNYYHLVALDGSGSDMSSAEALSDFENQSLRKSTSGQLTRQNACDSEISSSRNTANPETRV